MTLQPPQPIKPLSCTKPRNEMSYCTGDELLLKALYLWYVNDKDKEQKPKRAIGAVGRATN